MTDLGLIITSQLHAFIMDIYRTISAITLATSLCFAVSATDITLEAPNDSIEQASRYTRLTDYDYQRVAEELDVEIAAIKAVIDIEAGKGHHGFVAPGQPTLNFSTNMFRRALSRRGITVSAAKRRSSEAFRPLNRKKYGSYGKAQHARLESAMAIDSVSAITSCYWGMFQIGGFNWKKCGCSSPQEFANKMCESELAQLELFAHFIANNGMLKYLKAKNWYGFARIYNGRHAKRYASRMAAAYKRYKQ